MLGLLLTGSTDWSAHRKSNWAGLSECMPGVSPAWIYGGGGTSTCGVPLYPCWPGIHWLATGIKRGLLAVSDGVRPLDRSVGQALRVHSFGA